MLLFFFFFFSSRRRHTRWNCDWSSDVCSSDLDGPVQASIKEWPVPTPGSRPHDPRVARDGSIWWTGQLANKLGRLDPRTGEMKEYLLKTPRTGPHGLAEDREGNIWFTG